MPDLRDNPRLVLLGSGALDALGGALQELRLPRNLVYFSLACIQDLPALDIVRFEGDEEEEQDDSEGGGSREDEEPSPAEIMTSHMNPNKSVATTHNVTSSTPSGAPLFTTKEYEEPVDERRHRLLVRRFRRRVLRAGDASHQHLGAPGGSHLLRPSPE